MIITMCNSCLELFQCKARAEEHQARNQGHNIVEGNATVQVTCRKCRDYAAKYRSTENIKEWWCTECGHTRIENQTTGLVHRGYGVEPQLHQEERE